MALHFEKARAKTICPLEHDLFVLLNDKSPMKGDFHIRWCYLEFRITLPNFSDRVTVEHLK